MTHHVSRWHASPVEALRLSGDTIDAHQKRCVVLIRALIDSPPDTLIQAALHHDDPEKWLGDMPFTAKRDFPELAAAYARAESGVIAREGIPQPANEWEARVIKFVDRLDAYYWAWHSAPHVMADDDWEEFWRWLQSTAYDLDFSQNDRIWARMSWSKHVQASK
jgi:hypothetical protein